MEGAGIRGYRAFLAERDGTPDPRHHRLSRREEQLARLAAEPLRSALDLGRDAYLRNLERRRPEPGLDDRLLWLLATAKLNQAERFGVGLAERHGIHAGPDAAPEMVHVILQEHYHSRLLAEVLAIFDLPYPTLAPPWLFGTLIRWAVLVPERLSLPLAGASEIAGSVVLRLLRERGLALFAEEPAVAARIRLAYDEILADEICHVGYFAARMSPRARRIMHGLAPLVGRVIARQTPEIATLLGRRELARQLAAPFRIDERAAEFPGRAYVVS